MNGILKIMAETNDNQAKVNSTGSFNSGKGTSFNYSS